MTLDTPLAGLPGVGAARARALARSGLETVEDLLWRLPFRYEDRSRLATIGDLEEGVAATVRVVVGAGGPALSPTRRRGLSLLEVPVRDASGSLKVVFFNQAYLRDVLLAGREVYLYGVPTRRGLFLQLTNPQVEPVSGDPVHTGQVVPVYQKIESLGPGLHRTLVRRALDSVAGQVPENLPAEVLASEQLVGREEAFRGAHFPTAPVPEGLAPETSPALARLAFEELFVTQIGLVLGRASEDRGARSNPIAVDDELRERLRSVLPYRLTSAQKRVLREIAADLANPRPMRRLLQGDVGSGKTVVAALVMAVVAWNGAQSALMAPTELLAEQHATTLSSLLGSAGFRTALLTASVKGREREELLRTIRSGEVAIVIGTHALLQDEVAFHSLGLAVIDEQHRFGVEQRAGLGAKGRNPHLLVMTATPIPRSLALTVYGELDLSVIDELPPGRKPVRTVIKTGASEAETYAFIRSELEAGRQAYVVCPLVEESEKSDLLAAEEWARRVAERYFRGFAVGLVHGRQKASERRELMAAFVRGDVSVLVGTTVIEVGMDVANASIMVIEHSERFGLSQLHQLRGRIGRGPHRSTCVLMVRSRVDKTARARLEVVRATSDGFRIAEADLRLRGPGEILGTRQWGQASFQVANVLRDFRLLERARVQALRCAALPGFADSHLGRELYASYRRRAGRRRSG